MSEEKNLKKLDKTQSLSSSALAYQTSLEELLADISIELNRFQFKS